MPAHPPSTDNGFVLAPPDGLYTPAQLYEGFDPGEPTSLARTVDFRTYLATRTQGQRVATSPGVAAARALHDSAITQALAARVRDTKPVAIMGGHLEPRGSVFYNLVATIAWSLSRSGYLILTGGGPGAMEAAHLGARFAGRCAEELTAGLTRIARDEATRVFPFANEDEIIVGGGFEPSAMVRLHAWIAPAMEIAAETAHAPGRSIGIPTWLYGHEPSTPLATELAKYFENSIREDGLLALAVNGVVFAPGGAGTLQEIFQDAAQNFYVPNNEGPSPMVFLDVDGFWTQQYPVASVLQKLFGVDYDAIVQMVATADDAVAAIDSRAKAIAQWSDRAMDRKLTKRRSAAAR